MESEKNIIKDIKNTEIFTNQCENYEVLYDSFENYKKKTQKNISLNLNNYKDNENIDNFDKITFYYNFNNEKVKYTTFIKKGDTKTLKKYINKFYN